MLRFAYLCAEAITLYALLLVLAAIFCFGGGTPSAITRFVFQMAALVFVPVSIFSVTVGSVPGLMQGSHRPVRILALVAPGLLATLTGTSLPLVGFRREMRFRYRGGDGAPASYDVMLALSALLRADGVYHKCVGGISVERGDVEWWLEPTFGSNELVGWVEGAHSSDRQRVVEQLTHYLTQSLRLELS